MGLPIITASGTSLAGLKNPLAPIQQALSNFVAQDAKQKQAANEQYRRLVADERYAHQQEEEQKRYDAKVTQKKTDKKAIYYALNYNKLRNPKASGYNEDTTKQYADSINNASKDTLIQLRNIATQNKTKYAKDLYNEKLNHYKMHGSMKDFSSQLKYTDYGYTGTGTTPTVDLTENDMTKIKHAKVQEESDRLNLNMQRAKNNLIEFGTLTKSIPLTVNKDTGEKVLVHPDQDLSIGGLSKLKADNYPSVATALTQYNSTIKGLNTTPVISEKEARNKYNTTHSDRPTPAEGVMHFAANSLG